jgi:hypothetical protein
VFVENGISYIYIQHNNLYVLAVTRKNSNVAAILVFLERLVEVSPPAPAVAVARALLTPSPAPLPPFPPADYA